VNNFLNSVPRELQAVSALAARPRLPRAMIQAIRRHGIRPTRFALTIAVSSQSMCLFERRHDNSSALFPRYDFRRRYCISTSAYGVGQVNGSNQTPLGLHRIASKVGAGQPIGTVFRSRRVSGLTWQGHTRGEIVHRILWLEGLEPGFNRGGDVDTFQRYIYIHGFGDELTLGRPQSHGCIHVAAKDLMPLFDLLPIRSLVWIAER
jgi:hypothetical protein